MRQYQIAYETVSIHTVNDCVGTMSGLQVSHEAITHFAQPINICNCSVMRVLKVGRVETRAT